MIARLGGQVGSQVTGADANFYAHELLESKFMGSGMDYDAAHAAALDQAGVSPFSLYHPDVIQQFPDYCNSNWRAYWDLQ
jgi:filamentous hemagglutinin